MIKRPNLQQRRDPFRDLKGYTTQFTAVVATTITVSGDYLLFSVLFSDIVVANIFRASVQGSNMIVKLAK